MLLSIIIPVYNVEAYLPLCLDSILECSSLDYEILLVLKPSYDRSSQIARAYADQYRHLIRVLEQQGDGLSNARNFGMKEAKGEYIVFFDSDDMIEGESLFHTLEKVLLSAETPEVIISDYKIIGEDGRMVSIQHSIREDMEILDTSYMTEFLNKRRNYWNVWQYIFKKDFLEKNNFSFMEGMYSEDIEFSTRILLVAKQIVFVHRPYYNYRIGREGSLATAVTGRHIRDLMHILSVSVQRVRASETFSSKEQMQRRLYLQFFLALVMLRDIKKQDQKGAVEQIRQAAWKLFGLGLWGCIFSNEIVIRGTAGVLWLIRRLRRKILGIHQEVM